MDDTDSTRLDHDPAATSFPKMPVVSRGAEADRARVEAARLVFTFAEAEYARGRQAGGRDAMTACHRALGVASAAEVRATIAPLYGKPDYVDAVLRSLDALAGRAEGGERS